MRDYRQVGYRQLFRRTLNIYIVIWDRLVYTESADCVGPSIAVVAACMARTAAFVVVDLKHSATWRHINRRGNIGRREVGTKMREGRKGENGRRERGKEGEGKRRGNLAPLSAPMSVVEPRVNLHVRFAHRVQKCPKFTTRCHKPSMSDCSVIG